MDYLPLRAYRKSLGWSQEYLAERLMLLAHKTGQRLIGHKRGGWEDRPVPP